MSRSKIKVTTFKDKKKTKDKVNKDENRNKEEKKNKMKEVKKIIPKVPRKRSKDSTYKSSK